MVPHDLNELPEAIHAALARSRAVVDADKTSVSKDRALSAETRERGEAILDRLVSCFDEISNTLREHRPLESEHCETERSEP